VPQVCESAFRTPLLP